MNPTHYTLDAEGELKSLIFPNGHEDEPVYELPVEYWERPMLWVKENQWFVEDLASEKARLWNLVKEKRDAVRYGGCMTPKGRMDSDQDSQRKVNGAVTMAIMAGDAFTVDWTMEDNAVETHNAAEMMAAGVAVGQHESACHAVGQVLRAQIDAATQLEELWEIDIEGAPWPI